MLDHIGIRVKNFAQAKEFYSKTFAPLGYSLISEFAEWSVAGFGEQGKPDFWITADEKGGESAHVAFVVQGKDTVDAFHKAALEAGGKDNGAPGYRKDYSPGYYAAFAHDPDGHNIEVVFHDPNPTA